MARFPLPSMGHLDPLILIAIDYPRRQQSLLVLLAERVQGVGYTLGQCPITSIHVGEVPGVWRKDGLEPRNQLDASDGFSQFHDGPLHQRPPRFGASGAS